MCLGKQITLHCSWTPYNIQQNTASKHYTVVMSFPTPWSNSFYMICMYSYNVKYRLIGGKWTRTHVNFSLLLGGVQKLSCCSLSKPKRFLHNTTHLQCNIQSITSLDYNVRDIRAATKLWESAASPAQMFRISCPFCMDWIISRMHSLSCSMADAASRRASTLTDTERQHDHISLE